jgi:hypothetical protein
VAAAVWLGMGLSLAAQNCNSLNMLSSINQDKKVSTILSYNADVVGRLSKTTFIHISVHLYSSNVVTLSKPNLINKQQILLKLCLLLTHYTYDYSYLVLGVLQPTTWYYYLMYG